MSSTRIAVHVENGLFDSKLGRLSQGYNIITIEEAEAWMHITNKVRIANPQEVATAYGV